jgi:hypothetical protein
VAVGAVQRAQNGDAFGSRIWRRRPSLAAANPLRPAAIQANGDQPKTRRRDMSIFIVNLALIALAALSLAQASPRRQFVASKVVKS